MNSINIFINGHNTFFQWIIVKNKRQIHIFFYDEIFGRKCNNLVSKYRIQYRSRFDGSGPLVVTVLVVMCALERAGFFCGVKMIE